VQARDSQNHLFNNIQAELAHAGSAKLLNDPVAFGAIDHGQRLRLGQDSVFHAGRIRNERRTVNNKRSSLNMTWKTKGRRPGTIDCESGAAFLSHFFSAGQSDVSAAGFCPTKRYRSWLPRTAKETRNISLHPVYPLLSYRKAQL